MNSPSIGTMIICRGLPGSGKSTWAKAYQNVTRVNRDDLREMMHGGVWSKSNEKLVVIARDAIIRATLRAGGSVIVDDTNGTTVARLTQIAHEVDPNIYPVVRNFPISVKEAVRRDSMRPKPVGESVIRGMAHLFTDIILPD